MEHGHEHQEGQSHGPQEEDDLLYQEPCWDGVGGASISLCRPSAPLPLPGARGLWNRADLLSEPCSTWMAIVRTQ